MTAPPTPDLNTLPSRIADNLFLSSHKLASSKPLIEAFAITTVVNCMGTDAKTGKDYYGANVSYVELELVDDVEFDIYPHLRPAAEAVSKGLEQNGCDVWLVDVFASSCLCYALPASMREESITDRSI